MEPNESRDRIIANVRINNARKDIGAQISLMAIATGMTIINLCEYLVATEGATPEVEKVLASMHRFYRTSK